MKFTENQAERITRAIEQIAAHLIGTTTKPIDPSSREQLVARAEHNRDNAEELFGEVLELKMDGDTAGQWVERASGKPVVFTPYGWRLESEVPNGGQE